MEEVVVYTDGPWFLKGDGSLNPDLADIEREIFAGSGINIRFGLVENGTYLIKGDRFQNNLKGASALVIYRTQIREEIIEVTKPTLRMIGRSGVGYDNLNVDLLKREGIVGFNVPDYCISEVVSHTAALILGLERGIGYHDRLMKNGEWNIFEGNIPRRIEHLVLGIIGFGRIGKVVAQRLRPFFGEVVAYDPFVNADQMIAYNVRKIQMLQKLAEECDVITLHCVLSKEEESVEPTYQMIGDEFFDSMKTGAFLVNASRGAIVNNEALLKAIKRKKIGGAGIDVFAPENPNNDKVSKEIAAAQNVIATCHRAFLSRESERRQRVRTAENILHFLRDGTLPEVGVLTGEESIK